jgi:RNA polymerase sigma-70 factor, ECF subfamily
VSDRRKQFEAVALPHLDALYATAVRLCRNDRDAEDLVQDAMVKAYRFFDRFEAGSNGRAWLFKVMVNLFYNRYRQDQRERRLVEDADAGEHHGRFTSDAALRALRDPEGELLDRLTRQDVNRALERLPADFRAVVVLSDMEGFLYREIAEILDCPIGTVMSRLFRGRRLLRAMLADHAADAGLTVDLDAYRRSRT